MQSSSVSVGRPEVPLGRQCNDATARRCAGRGPRPRCARVSPRAATAASRSPLMPAEIRSALPATRRAASADTAASRANAAGPGSPAERRDGHHAPQRRAGSAATAAARSGTSRRGGAPAAGRRRRVEGDLEQDVEGPAARAAARPRAATSSAGRPTPRRRRSAATEAALLLCSCPMKCQRRPGHGLASPRAWPGLLVAVLRHVAYAELGEHATSEAGKILVTTTSVDLVGAAGRHAGARRSAPCTARGPRAARRPRSGVAARRSSRVHPRKAATAGRDPLPAGAPSRR